MPARPFIGHVCASIARVRNACCSALCQPAAGTLPPSLHLSPCSYISLIKEEGLEGVATVPTPALQAAVATTTPARCASAGERRTSRRPWIRASPALQAGFQHGGILSGFPRGPALSSSCLARVGCAP